MSSPRVPGGVVHRLPPDLRRSLVANPTALDAWRDITPLARNEFICWVEDAKQQMNSGTPHPADGGGARGGPAEALLLAGVHTPRAHRPLNVPDKVDNVPSPAAGLQGGVSGDTGRDVRLRGCHFE
jgi:hypothetical protein